MVLLRLTKNDRFKTIRKRDYLWEKAAFGRILRQNMGMPALNDYRKEQKEHRVTEGQKATIFS